MHLKSNYESILSGIHEFKERIKSIGYDQRDNLIPLQEEIVEILPNWLQEPSEIQSEINRIKYVPMTITDFTTLEDLEKYWLLGQSELNYILGKVEKGASAALELRREREEGLHEHIQALTQCSIYILHCSQQTQAQGIKDHLISEQINSEMLDVSDEYDLRILKALSETPSTDKCAVLLFTPEQLIQQNNQPSTILQAGIAIGCLQSWMDPKQITQLHLHHDEISADQLTALSSKLQ